MKLFRTFVTLCFLLTAVPALGTGTVTFFQEFTTAEEQTVFPRPPAHAGTAEDPFVSGFPIRNKATGEVYYAGGSALYWDYGFSARTVDVQTAGGVADAVRRRILLTGTGIAFWGGRGRSYFSIGGGLECFFLLREPGTITLTAYGHDGEEASQTFHYRCPTLQEIDQRFRPHGNLNPDLVEPVGFEVERRLWERDEEEIPAETLEDILKAIEDAVDRLRAHPGVVN